VAELLNPHDGSGSDFTLSHDENRTESSVSGRVPNEVAGKSAFKLVVGIEVSSEKVESRLEASTVASVSLYVCLLENVVCVSGISVSSVCGSIENPSNVGSSSKNSVLRVSVPLVKAVKCFAFGSTIRTVACVG
jgi:hypothetical protein